MNKKELAVRLDISLATLYNWEKSKPELIKLINLGLKAENNENTEDDNDIKKYYYELSKEEQDMYLFEIKARVMRKKLKQ